MKLSLFTALCFAALAAAEIPHFAWQATRRGNADGIQEMQVTFNDGFKDTLLLEPYSSLKGYHNPCILMGYLENEVNAVAAVTGCPGENAQITLLSNRLMTGNNQFHLIDGKISMIPSPFNETNFDVVKVREEIRQDDGWTKKGDEEINNDLEAAAVAAGATCSGANRNELACAVASSHILSIQVAYDDSLKNDVADPLAWVTSVLAHTQTFYYDPSLVTKIKLEQKSTPIYKSGQTWRADLDSSIDAAKGYAKADQDVNLWAFFCKDTVSSSGVVGVAYVGAICLYSSGGYHISINEKQSSDASTAAIVAHELGHNFGMDHDASPCEGIMNPYTGGPTTWSSCSNTYFTEHYEYVVTQKGSHCMTVVTGETPTDTTTGGTPTDTTTTTTTAAPTGCQYPQWVGDAYCDDGNNNANCNWDGGDCCPPHTIKTWKKYCQTCQCLDPSIPKRCKLPGYVGDGYCDDGNNIVECGYDGGDCCSNTNANWDFFCTTCSCLV